MATLGVGVTPIANAATLATAPSAAVSTIAADPDAEVAALKELKATYFRDVDSKQWLALRNLYIPGAVVDTTSSFGPYFVGRDPFVAFTALTLSLINTRHQGYDPQITLDSDSTAEAVWTMQDRLSLAGLVTIHGYGHYTDHYVKVDGKWLVADSTLSRAGFELEFPAVQKFVTEFTEVWNSQGPVAALLYTVSAVVTIPVNAVGALVGAALSNFGGPATKAEPIQVPPGAQDPTNPEPAISAIASRSMNAVALSGPAPTTSLAPAGAPGAEASAKKRVEPVESPTTQLAEDTSSGATITDSTDESPKTSDDDALKITEPKTTEPKTAEPKTTEPKTTEPKTTEPKATEPKTAEPKSSEPKDSEPKKAATPST